MGALHFTVDRARCIRCNRCIADCPVRIVKATEQGIAVPRELEDDCIECQHCLAICPTAAISIFQIKPENCEEINPESLPSKAQMAKFVRARRSVRQFRPGNVEPELVRELLESAVHAPTGCNDRALTFTVIDDAAAMGRFREKAYSRIEEAAREPGREVSDFLVQTAATFRRDGTDALFRGAPHLLVVTAGAEAHCGREDIVIALSYFELLAQSAGVGTVWCGYLPRVAAAVPEVRGDLGIGYDEYFYAMLFGNPAIRYARTVRRDDDLKIRRWE